MLRIIPCQILTHPVPDSLTGSMVQQAAFDPAVAQRLIEKEGLRHMGFSAVKDAKVASVSLTYGQRYLQSLNSHSESFPLFRCIRA